MFETRAPAVRFDRLGATVEGEIVDARRTQQTEFRTFVPLYWERQGTGAVKTYNSVSPATGQANDPIMQTEITLDTGTPDENGDTERRLFVRGKRMDRALKAAVAKGGGGRDGLLIGGHLSCTWTGTEASGAGQDAKLYDFTYRPPAAGEGRKPDATPVLAGDGWGEPVAVASAMTVQQQPRPAWQVRDDDEPPF